MFKFLRKKKAQSTLEYAVLLIIVIGALLSIQVYVKRGIQGRMRSASDDIGSQFKPGGMNMLRTTTFRSNTKETFVDGISNSILIENETTDVDYYEEMLDTNIEFWG